MKKLFAVLLSFCMIFTLVGCSSSDTDEEDESGVTKIKIGMTGPLTGGAAIYGIACQNGAQIAVDEINALGGDIQFEFSIEDDEHDAEKAVTAINSLIDWGMQISMSSVTTAPATATSVELAENNIFGLTPSASGTAVVEGNTNVFQMCFTDPNQGMYAAQYIANNSLGTNIAVIWENDIDYSAGIYATFIAEAEELGLNIVYDGTFTSESANDFTVQLTQAQEAGADLVFLPIYYQEASLILAQAANMDFSPVWFGVDGMDGILTLEGFDTSLAEGVILLTPFNADSDDETTAAFVAKYEDLYGETPNQFAADAYDCIYAIYQACVDGGITADMTASEMCEILVEQFTTMTFDGITGTGATWSADGYVSKEPKGMIIQDGAYVGLD